MRLLEDYRRRHPEESSLVARFLDLLEAGPEALQRTHRPGHITASAVVLSPDAAQVLLTHHRKLDIWIQLGGHADGEHDLLAAALREAEEESGLSEISPAAVSIVDLDIHGIPAHGTEGAHDHYDVRFCFTADPGHELTVSDESHDLAWVPVARLNEYSNEESLYRAVRRAQEAVYQV
jgi:8-oxo-dGTP pyrophosphatase MutT (NUDIX family)